jgi:hypothetical protein
MIEFENPWTHFKESLPHTLLPYSKRNWGHPLHSVCSYAGKMKPSLAHYLVKAFVPEGGTLLDPFAGVGTIPFEGALLGHKSWGFEISRAAEVISTAKLRPAMASEYNQVLDNLERHLQSTAPESAELERAKTFGFNRTLEEYFDPATLAEIIQARAYFRERPNLSDAESMVMASLLHILHGNRPYALSRRSHPITPFAPSGPFEYRSLMPRLRSKVERNITVPLPDEFEKGQVLHQDATAPWPDAVVDLDAVITSPPFFDSTRFYLANWMRLWFCGWERDDFQIKPKEFVDERQKRSFDVYLPILEQARDRLKPGGKVVFHLGKSRKADMAKSIAEVARPYFERVEIFEEGVSHIERHGVRDKGTVTEHQYLVLS